VELYKVLSLYEELDEINGWRERERERETEREREKINLH
jgi:heme-degrading monooxygenase HmoA